MAKKAAEKTANISMAGFHPRANAAIDKANVGAVMLSPEANPAPSSVGKTFTGAGLFMAAITGKDEVSKELLDAKAKLSEFQGASVVRALDPKTVGRSQWANRNEAEFLTPDFQQLRDEILNAGGNVQPIKVRPVKGTNGVFDGQTPIYEIVFGHRRHQACLELGLLVNAIVDMDMDDKALFEAMDRENRNRKNLSAWEQGRMYETALNKGLYPSLRQLSEGLGVNLSDVSRALQLARLPKDVVGAFRSPLDLQVRWAKPLTDSLQRDPDAVLLCAKTIGKNRGNLVANEIFNRLVGNESKEEQEETLIMVSGKPAASIKNGRNGRVVVEFEHDMLPKTQRESFAKLVENFLKNV